MTSERSRGESEFKPAHAMCRRAVGIAVALLSVCFAGPAFAHHFMGGQVPRTALQGLLSGLGHPVIGLDHLAFIIGVGLLASLSNRPWLVPLPFIAGTLAGAFLHLAGVEIPLYEMAICTTVLAVGVAVFMQRHQPLPLLASLIGGAGLLHGYAYAESIFGAEQTPLYAYLIGFALVQYAIAAGSATLFRLVTGRYAISEAAAFRSAGLVIAVAGVFMIAGIF